MLQQEDCFCIKLFMMKRNQMVTVINKKNWAIKGLLALILLLGGIFIVKHFFYCPELQIQSYKESRDKEFIYGAFKQDLYWLVENPEFEVDYMLNTNSPNRNPKH